jgi:uncharacterized damage-inducible protein DinB
MKKSDRDSFRPGAVGSLMDLFEDAANELGRLIEGLTDDELEAVRNPVADEEEMRSIQGVVNHVVRAGYAHANHLRLAFFVPGSRVEVPPGNRRESLDQLVAMVAYMEATLDGRWDMTDEEMEAVKIESRWGTTYDLEQMLEHAVVHVLRHRRQIERFREPTERS